MGFFTWDDSPASCLAKGFLMGLYKSVFMSIKLENDNLSGVRPNDDTVGVHLKSITQKLLLGI